MSLESVLAFITSKAPELRVTELWDTSGSGMQAIISGQLAKSLFLNAGCKRIMIVMAGNARLDNKKCRLAFGVRPRMLAAKVVETSTGHAVDAVSPMGVACKIPVYCDLSLRRFNDIYLPADGLTKVVKIPVNQMASLVSAGWVDVSRPIHLPNETARRLDYDFIPA